MHYVLFQGQTGQRAYQRHYSLEGPEEQGHSQRVPDMQLPVSTAADNRDNKRVHR